MVQVRVANEETTAGNNNKKVCQAAFVVAKGNALY
jgi:hypothetical protein